MPSLNHGLGPRLVTWLWSGRYAAVKVQLIVVGLLITLLNLGYYWQRELRDIALQQHLGSLIDLWDGVEWYAWVAVG